MKKSVSESKFKPGDVIHETLIHRKYKDVENGEIFVSLFGLQNRILRVDSSNRFIYDTPFESSGMPELILMEERRPGLGNSLEKQESGALDLNLRPYLKKAFILKGDQNVSVYDESYQLLGLLVEKDPLEPEPQEPVEEVLEVEEEVEVDRGKPSVYLDPTFKFDFHYNGEIYAIKEEDGFFTLTTKTGETAFEYYTNHKFLGLDKSGKYLTFRNDNGSLYGKNLDGSLVNSVASDEASAVKREVSENSEKAPEPLEKVKLKPQEVVELLVKSVQKSLNKNSIEAGYFLKERVSDTNRLIEVMEGNLGRLNDETSEAFLKGIQVNYRGGFNLLKASLLHEIFINTTLKGRGGHRSVTMRQLILEMVMFNEGGGSEQDKSVISVENQKRVLDWLLEFKKNFRDKEEVIEVLLKKIAKDDEMLKMAGNKDFVRSAVFKAMVISKIYEYTTRQDRGNGLAIIALSRALMDINQKST